MMAVSVVLVVAIASVVVATMEVTGVVVDELGVVAVAAVMVNDVVWS